VLLTYENEVILTNMHYGDKALPYVVPPCNVRIECPISQVDQVSPVRGLCLVRFSFGWQTLDSCDALLWWSVQRAYWSSNAMVDEF